MKFGRITVDSTQMGGVPCIRGLRIPVSTVVGMLAEGMTDEEMLTAFLYIINERLTDVVIPNSLIGLETGVVRDADFLISWNRQRYPNDGRPNIAPFIHWWQDHTLRSAMRHSVLWYYIEIARQVGARRMQRHITQFRYGNRNTSGGIEQFWRNSTLQISADEQVDFLRRFYTDQLSVSRRSTEIVKDIMLMEQTAAYRLSGKTGAAPRANGGTLAWFVGYLEREGNVYFFALNMDGAGYASIRDERINLTKRILTELGLLPR